MFYDEKQEKMPRPELRQLQVERLQSTLNRVYRNVAFYKRLFDAHGVDPLQVKDLAALGRIPFTTKDDLRRSYPYDMFAVPLRDVARIQSTSGTTGKAIGIGYTANDLRHWSGLVARVLAAAGVTRQDRVQVAFQFSLFTGGFGFYQGAERLGASVIPASSVAPLPRQVEIMRDFKSTVLCCTPSFALRLAGAAAELGVHREALNLRCAVLGAEPWSESLRGQIEDRLRVKAYDNYGLSEIMGPGVSAECAEQHGLHVQEDHFIVEVVDPASGEPAPPGQSGELVFTTITKEAFPLVRYRTGDIASLDETPCPCGRTFVRMSRVTGRTDDLLFAQGAKFFPSQIEEVLLRGKGVTPNFSIELRGKHGEDVVEIRTEVAVGFNWQANAALERKLGDDLEATLGLKAKITFLPPGAIPATQGKRVIKVVDQRSP